MEIFNNFMVQPELKHHIKFFYFLELESQFL